MFRFHALLLLLFFFFFFFFFFFYLCRQDGPRFRPASGRPTRRAEA
jgi:hypothetical protein